MSVFIFDIQEPTITCPGCGKTIVAKLHQKIMFSYAKCPECKVSIRPDLKTRLRILFCGSIALGLLLVMVTGIVAFPSQDEPFTLSHTIWFAIGFLLLALLAIMKKRSGWETCMDREP